MHPLSKDVRSMMIVLSAKFALEAINASQHVISAHVDLMLFVMHSTIVQNARALKDSEETLIIRSTDVVVKMNVQSMKTAIQFTMSAEQTTLAKGDVFTHVGTTNADSIHAALPESITITVNALKAMYEIRAICSHAFHVQ